MLSLLLSWCVLNPTLLPCRVCVCVCVCVVCVCVCVYVHMCVLQRERYEKRLHKMKSASAQSRTESALVTFELKEQNGRLKEENSLLLGEKGWH